MDFKQIEQKWQKKWEEEKLYSFDTSKRDNKYYVLEMFSYPSGAKLHAGHWYNYGPTTLYNNCLYGSANLRSSVTNGLGDAATTATAATYSIDSVQGANTRCMAKKSLDLELSAAKNINATIETGRIEKGSHSNQEFENVFIDFEYCSFAHETIQILPESQKPYTDKDLKKVYCVNCGRKLNTKYKFCPYCGYRIVY